MRIALHNPFIGLPVPERELCRRISLAAQNLGWEAIEVGTSDEIDAMKPDAVFVFHQAMAKVSGFPTYGCMWNPPHVFDQHELEHRDILSYDGYLCAADTTELWLRDHLLLKPKTAPFIPFFTSCNRTEYRKPDFTNPKLMYVGSYWGAGRFQNFFTKLEEKGFTHFYGNPAGWSYLKKDYKGAIPFDGHSLLNILHQSGVGLCLHTDDHTRAEVASMRIFEIAASSALAICGRHAFIEKSFGDSVLYIDNHVSDEERVKQIEAYMAWIKAHPEKAEVMCRRAHQIFVERFCFEKLLTQFKESHDRALQHAPIQTEVQMIVLASHQPDEAVTRALENLHQQEHRNIHPIFVHTSSQEQFIVRFKNQFPKFTVVLSESPVYSTRLWAAFQHVTAPVFGILEPSSVFFKNHVSHLLRLMAKKENADLVYAASSNYWESVDQKKELHARFYNHLLHEPSYLPHVVPADLSRLLVLEQPIQSCAFLCRSTVLESTLLTDPLLDECAVLYFLLYLYRTCHFEYSYEMTVRTYKKLSHKDDAPFAEPSLKEENKARLRRIFRNQHFPNGIRILESEENNIARPQVLDLVRKIAKVKTTVFWRGLKKIYHLLRRIKS
jgi:hypothetical protein